MKRIRLLILLSVLAVALPVGVFSGVAKGAGGTSDQVTINQHAQFDVQRFLIHVGLRVRCEPAATFGLVMVEVTQEPPESPTSAFGDGEQEVVCDGQTHSVGVSVTGVGFDAGRATAKALLIPPDANPITGEGTVKAQRTIDIIVMPG